MSLVRRNMLLVLLLLPFSSALAESERKVMGWVEDVVIEPPGFNMEAKLDSGALTSSLHATNIERFKKDGEEWVRFTVHNGDGSRSKLLEKPLYRDVLIKRHGADSQRRPVVRLAFCLAGQSHEAQFSLTDRSNFIYPVLLGRRFLGDVALIDSRDRHLTTGSCQDQEEYEEEPEGDSRTESEPEDA
ncbi:hypothetical protein CAI21_05490 [Alkalilimnicola ehrlichii]|uniref:Retropepsin-like aspartic endopeptidase domain-containing protein n=1 Tax=Alkalilimnicola ehrlichii TaxID=351052 RepID=A0A3E0X0V2_9GAMM|nr:RimK/LysX family protein [Alkalilimnicola ehrlichii]RFA30501.1 hypothetical protein CAI21_05490 [Alkalilimnicola ehrlichii]RFA38051.1 hypothetical protein CAL65_06860 [Alkalilimnicola ehrlichii]